MPITAGAVMAGGQLLGSIIGGSQAKKAQEAAAARQAEYMKKAITELEKVGIPSVEAQQIALTNPELVFNYVPQLEQEFPEIKSQMESVEADPRLKEMQSSALQGLEERASMGLTAEDQAELNAMRRDVEGADKARQSGILQEMERKGLGGSGVELASRLASSQEATQRAAEASDSMAAMNFEAKQAALQNLLSGSSNVRSQDLSEDTAKASALDSIAQFNAQNTSAVQQRNIAAQNAAEQQRQQLLQTQADQKASLANQEQMYNKGLIQTNYQNEMGKAQGLASAYTGQAQQAAQAGANEAANKQAMWSGIGQAAGSLGGAAAQSYGSTPSATSSTPSSFSSAFAAARKAHGGDGGTFVHNGKKYTTDLKK